MKHSQKGGLLSLGFPDGNLSHYVRSIPSSLVLAESEAGEPSMLVLLVVGGRPPVSEAA